MVTFPVFLSYQGIVIYSMSKELFPFLSVRDVALASDLSVPNIYKHIGLGHLAAIKLPNFKNYMIPAAALSEFLRARAEGRFKRPQKRSAVKVKP
jgi:hypothetical protein